MKKLLLFFVAASLTVSLYGAIDGTAHDFSSETWNPSGEICIVCHTPHNADPYNLSIADAPLWNHDANMTTTYTLYSSSTLQATPVSPSGVSKLCLSCHDGVTAIDTFGGGVSATYFLTSADSTFVDTDLSNDHPISFTYNAALATSDGELFDPTTATTPLGGTIQADLLDGGTTMECSSCHDVHGVIGTNYLLKIANTGSQLCLTCHDK